MTRVLAFPHVGNLQVHSTTPRLDLAHLRHNVHTRKSTSYTYKVNKVFCHDEDGKIENDYAIVGALDFFRDRMCLPPNTCIRVDPRCELVIPSQSYDESCSGSMAFLRDECIVGIFIVSQKNVSGV